MGMFDDLRCEMPIPVEWDARRGWQTKSLGCEMDSYTITADGRLLRREGSWGRGEVPEMVIPYHGDIEFHDYDNAKGYLRMIARFTEGACVRIWMAEWDPPHGKTDVLAPVVKPLPSTAEGA